MKRVSLSTRTDKTNMNEEEGDCLSIRYDKKNKNDKGLSNHGV